MKDHYTNSLRDVLFSKDRVVTPSPNLNVDGPIDSYEANEVFTVQIFNSYDEKLIEEIPATKAMLVEAGVTHTGSTFIQSTQGSSVPNYNKQFVFRLNVILRHDVSKMSDELYRATKNLIITEQFTKYSVVGLGLLAIKAGILKQSNWSIRDPQKVSEVKIIYNFNTMVNGVSSNVAVAEQSLRETFPTCRFTTTPSMGNQLPTVIITATDLFGWDGKFRLAGSILPEDSNF